MAMSNALDLLMFAVAFGLLLAGYHVAFTLAGVALFFAAIGYLLNAFPIGHLNFIAQRMYVIMTNETLIAVPLFVFMGLMLERSKVADELLTSMTALFGARPGGLAISVTLVGALLAASTGIVGATVMTLGLLALPIMIKNGYDMRLASGTICASGTLGQIIPPSIVLVFLGDFLTNANQQANMISGNLRGSSVSVADLFAGALIPGLCLVALYILYICWVAWRYPDKCRPLSDGLMEEVGQHAAFTKLMKVMFPPLALIIAVLGSILSGVATPTEAAAVGAVGAILLAASRAAPKYNVYIVSAVAAGVALVFLRINFDLRIQRSVISPGEWGAIAFALIATLILIGVSAFSVLIVLRDSMLAGVVRRTTRITAMVFTILIGASLFTLVFRGFGGEDTVRQFLEGIPGGLFGAMAVIMLVVFFLGFFLDFMEITFIVVPIVAPILILMGADPIWLGVMFAVNLQTSFLSPPFGFALFFFRSVAPASVLTGDIYWGAMPFVLIQFFVLVLIALVPGLATWLPGVLYSTG